MPEVFWSDRKKMTGTIPMKVIPSPQFVALVLLVLVTVHLNTICESRPDSDGGDGLSKLRQLRSASFPGLTGNVVEPDEQTIEDSYVILSKNNLTQEIEEKLGIVLHPSDTCRLAAEKFGNAVSNFTLCSVTNARPIHICGLCVGQYLSVLSSHHEFISTIDELGTECSEYYLNLDRIEIVSAAFHYVKSLWKEGNCDYCFLKDSDGKLLPNLTNDTQHFEQSYDLVRECFDVFTNESCTSCKPWYKEMNDIYVIIRDTTDDNICLDIVDTMNTTREMWSRVYQCMPVRHIEFGIIFGISFVALIPVLFYPLAFMLSKKQHAEVLKQKRMAVLAGIFGFRNSQSSASIDVVGGSHSHTLPSTSARSAASNIPSIFRPSTSSQSASDTEPKRRATVVF